MQLFERIKKGVLSEKYVLKKGYIWNSLASMITAVSSIGVLLIVTRFAGKEIGANLSIAIAIINVLMNVGHMNVIGYQVSDIREKYLFNTYFRQRCWSVSAMIVLATIYAFCKYGLGAKTEIIIAYGVYKGVNVFCELFQGRYQQKGRIDIASKLNFLKVLIPDAILCLLTIVSSNFMLAIGVAIFVEMIVIMVFNQIAWEIFRDGRKEPYKNILKLTKEVFPLFYSAFAAAYILNSAKYAIDNNMQSQYQLIYAVLLLPATTVHMIAGFIYRPVLTVYANIWNEGKYRVLASKIIKIIMAILACTVLIVVGKGIILKVLAWTYGLPEIKEYGFAFGILLLAGGVNALNVFLSYILTIVRKQGYLYTINTVTFLCAVTIPNSLVRRFGINGAARSYLMLMLIQMINYAICFVVWRTRRRNIGEE